MNTQKLIPLPTTRSANVESVRCMLDHPDKVLKHPRLSRSEKRALLASWASDAYAIQHQPTLRRLDGGNVVPVEQILIALKTLDEMPDAGKGNSASILPWSRGRSFLKGLRRPGQSAGPDDDDDPPPCPANIAPRPRAPGGMGVKAFAELASA